MLAGLLGQSPTILRWAPTILMGGTKEVRPRVAN